ncbi:cupredoxin domain-containing protein [Paludibacterium yongneupense]|uniref:cupredoxin domain-containing protein n=1 Tax=Paludibacterium yongneupense TaxID=400061 RepID=UPI00042081D8|nr:cupredoxin family protein [Paludibacterium yongneupense]
MNRLLPLALIALGGLLPQASAFAHATRFAFGSPGTPSEVTRTIHVDANDAMKLVFDSRDIRQGDVVKFVVHNSGRIAHEFGIDDAAGQREHAAMMRQMPGMVHDDPNVIALKPGETRQLIWKFTKLRERTLIFACNVPGHYQAGMFLRLTIQP